MNGLIVYLINIILNLKNVFYNLIEKIDLGLLNFIVEELLNKSDIVSQLIGYEVTLISLYFVFIPVIIQEKKNEVYLGHNVSQWILYRRKKISKIIIKTFKKGEEKISDTCLTFTFSIFLIAISIYFYFMKCNLIVIFVFVIFILNITKKVVEYINLVSTDKAGKEIEENFKHLCVTDNEKIIRMLKDNIDYKIENNRKTFNYLLNNLNNIENCKKVSVVFYKQVINFNDIESYKMLYTEIYEAIKKCQNSNAYLNFTFNPWDLKVLLEYELDDSNANYIKQILINIINNSISMTKENNNYYNEIVSISYTLINKNKKLEMDTKTKLLNVILSTIKYIDCDENDENNFIKFKYIVNFYKKVIMLKDNHGINFMRNNIKNCVHKDSNIYPNVLMTTLMYLYYLIEIESPKYVEEKEKKVYKEIYVKIKKIQQNYYLEYYYNKCKIEELFEWIYKIYDNWEIYDNKKNILDINLKTPVVENMINTAKRSLNIIFQKDENEEVLINENDLKLFANLIKNKKIETNEIENIKKFTGFIGLELNDKTLDLYAEDLTNYAKTVDDKKQKEETLNLNAYSEKIIKIKNDLVKSVAKSELFNATSIKTIKTFKKSAIIDKKSIDTYAKYDITQFIDFKKDIETYIMKNIYNKNIVNIKYKEKEKEKILNILNIIKKKYYYIKPFTDSLDRAQKNSNDYRKKLLKFKVINTSINDTKFLINNYKCELKNIDIQVRKINGKDLLEKIESYKIEDNIYTIVDENGFEIIYSKDEIRKYCKNKYVKIIFNIDIGLDVEKTKGYRFIYIKDKIS